MKLTYPLLLNAEPQDKPYKFLNLIFSPRALGATSLFFCCAIRPKARLKRSHMQCSAISQSHSKYAEGLLDSPYEGILVEWLLNTVFQHIRAWRRLGVFVPRISLNLSARQLLGAGLADRILHIARTHDVSPAMLDIEVTEDSLVSDIEQATSVLAALKQAGIFTSLDDFGSGYSSPSYLVRLPIDTLKIDKSFVRAPVDSVARPLATALCARIGASMIGCHFWIDGGGCALPSLASSPNNRRACSVQLR